MGALCRRMSASMPLFEPLFQPAAMHQLLFQQPTGLSSGRPTAAMQVVEHEHEYRVEIDAPGLAPSDIKVAIDDGILSVEGKRNETHEKKDESGAVVYSERRSSAFARRIELPENHDPNQIAARAQDGSYRLSSRRNRKMSRYPNVVKFPSRGKPELAERCAAGGRAGSTGGS